MAVLITIQGPDTGRQFQLESPTTVLGRQIDSNVCLTAKAVSRQHAQITLLENNYFLEDLGSSNGTYINGQRVYPRSPVMLTEKDQIQIGPYVLAIRPEPTVTPTEGSLVVRETVSAMDFSNSVYNQDPAQKLQVVLEISQQLAGTLQLEDLLDKIMELLMKLLPQADRCMVLLLEGENLVVRGQRCRHKQDGTTYPYSRTVVKRALEEGVGLLSEDVKGDERFESSATLTSLNLHSLICVPLITKDGRRLGIIQADRFRQGTPFKPEDLHLLTTICQQISFALDNAALHAQLIHEERLRQELVLAREIQQGFMPSEFEEFQKDGFDLFATMYPAREVSGDLYEFSRLEDGRFAFFVGDVSGKGMPAALFMVAVRTLSRHLASERRSPAENLILLNKSLSQDNPSGMFVTLAHGIYDPGSGKMVLASGGHHLPLLRKSNGQVEEISHRAGRLLGYEGLDLRVTDVEFTLDVGDLLVFYTDGYTEAKGEGSKEMFGLERLKKQVGKMDSKLSLPECADLAKSALDKFCGERDQQDDLTLFLMRRLKLSSDK